MKNSEKCPLCESGHSSPIGKDFRLCVSCGAAFNTGYRQLSYDDSYFLDEYKKQYGRTYVEDFDGIYISSLKRIKKIFSLIKKKRRTGSLSLLDIGSAMGFFLKAASDWGIKKVRGIEISEYAARWCRNEYGFDIIPLPFELCGTGDSYDIITAWFFIEHCQDPALAVHKIYAMLTQGGVFAFSVPSIFGPLYRFNRDEWIEKHPADHRVDFSPRSVKKILDDIGFTRITTRPSGIHPERVMKESSFFYRPFSVIYRLFSRLFSFSDTLEVYAVK